jgi:acetyl-CoA carboxylase/biotin carboxylase 1
LNVLHFAVADGEYTDNESIERALAVEKSKLELLGIRTINILVPSKAKDPAYYTFPQCDGYKESPIRRNMRPTFHHLLNLPFSEL